MDRQHFIEYEMKQFYCLSCKNTALVNVSDNHRCPNCYSTHLQDPTPFNAHLKRNQPTRNTSQQPSRNINQHRLRRQSQRPDPNIQQVYNQHPTTTNYIHPGRQPIRLNHNLQSTNQPQRFSNQPQRSPNQPQRSPNQPIKSPNIQSRLPNQPHRSPNQPHRSPNQPHRSPNQPIKSSNIQSRLPNQPLRNVFNLTRQNPARSSYADLRDSMSSLDSSYNQSRNSHEEVKTNIQPTPNRSRMNSSHSIRRQTPAQNSRPVVPSHSLISDLPSTNPQPSSRLTSSNVRREDSSISTHTSPTNERLIYRRPYIDQQEERQYQVPTPRLRNPAVPVLRVPNMFMLLNDMVSLTTGNMLIDMINMIQGTFFHNPNRTIFLITRFMDDFNMDPPDVHSFLIESQHMDLGNLGDLLTNLASRLPEGPRPASEQRIRNLEDVRVTSRILAEQPSCAVCQDNFKLLEYVKKLSCEHIFHDDCITPWLRVNNTCPLCRQAV